MNRKILTVVMVCFLSGLSIKAFAEKDYWKDETSKEREERMEWWREARFGMFIHWGLYAIPAGEWDGKTNYAEWIKRQAKIPKETYDKFVGEFNPVKFDADAWVRMAKRAGMKYIVITSKHHDGFCLWPSDKTDYDIASTPYEKDILRQLTEACKKHGVRMCFYHSVMDWHHPHYLPKHSWDPGTNPPEGQPDYSKYVDYMKSQLEELVKEYDPGVLWFDGEWEGTWTHDMGKDLYQYVRSLKEDIIINNRVDKGRRGMQGFNKEGEFRGDFGTPEQEIPETGIPGVDWESCMTMNNHWGWNKADKSWKSSTDLIQKLADIASKGGNFLLNIGPKADGTFPDEAIERLEAIGKWMDVNSESIYDTEASPFKHLDWGRCSMKKTGRNTRLYLHVFNWPSNGKITIPLKNDVEKAYLLADTGTKIDVKKDEFSIELALPAKAPDEADSVIVLDIKGEPGVVKLDPYAGETQEERNARMGWWRDSKFGMFIHWGVYSVPAGTYKDEQIKGIGEWIMLRGKIPVQEYREFSKEFNPVKYDADEWVRLAKEAGMKYIVITSKHHDGFALFDSKVTDWDIADATPYKKDLLRPLVNAAKKHGLKIGFYYSQAQDWTHPGGAKYSEEWDETHKGDFDKYLRDIAYPQVKEILSGYDIDVLWWDTPKDMTKERAELLMPLLNLRPGIIHNNRLGGGYKGDTDTPEQHIPDTGIPGRDWETCMTMNGTWGYKSYDNNWKSTETLVRNLVDIVSKGGNYLLNIGPKKDGTIPQESIDRLKEVGAWMKVNGESIYETQASPCKKPVWGRITRKESGNETTLFLHVFDWPADGKISVPLANDVKSCCLLADSDRRFETERTETGINVQLTGTAPDKICSVVKLVIKEKPEVTALQSCVEQKGDGSIILNASDAISRAPQGVEAPRLEKKVGDRENLGFWTDSNAWVEWKVRVQKPVELNISAELAAPTDSKMTISAVTSDGKVITSLDANTKSTGAWETFNKQNLGKIKLSEEGVITLAVRPDKNAWQPVNLLALTFNPEK